MHMPHASSRIGDDRPIYAWSVALLLAVAQVFSFIDRQILSLLIGPIRADMQISDTQVALLHGMAFIIFYSVMGIPFGRWADRGNRPLIIALGLAFWSLATAACGLARGFWSLFAARVGVGVGEASLSPAALSLLSDYFPEAKLGRAVGLYMGGIFVGSGLAYVLGGAITEWAIDLGQVELPILGSVRGWQITFVAIGMPGLLLALLFPFVIEPRRHPARHAVTTPVETRFDVVWKYLWHHRGVYGRHYVGFGLATALLYGLMLWVPQCFVRTFGTSIAEAGLYFGLSVLLFGPLGAFCSGWLADRGMRAGRKETPMRTAAFGFAVALPITVAFGLAPNLTVAIALCAPLGFLLGFPFGLATSSLQLIAPPDMRGQATAVYYITVNVIGFTAGPLSIALMTDKLFQADSALHYSIALSAFLFIPLAVWLFWTARKPFEAEVEKRMASASHNVGSLI